MSRIDDLARGLVTREAQVADAAELPLERIARAAATSISRRHALRLLGGVLVTATVPTSLVSPARGAAGCTACGVEHGEGCVGDYKCGQGVLVDEPVCCKFPGYFEPFSTDYGTCAQAGGHGETPPGGAVCCCPAGFTCGNPAVEACVCPNTQCGSQCCKPGEECHEPPGADNPEDLICLEPCAEAICYWGAGAHCCTDADCCGDGCCPDGEACCSNSEAEWCCPSSRYTCSGDAFQCGCLPLQECGEVCCPLGTWCYRERFGECLGPQRDHYDELLDFLRTLLPGGAVAGASASAARSTLAGAAAARGSTGAVVAVAAVGHLAALAHDRLRASRPDSAYRRPVKVRKPRLGRLAPGPGLDPPAARALHKLLSAEADAWALLNAAAVARARSLGAIRARNLEAARRQARASGRLDGEAAKALRQIPALSRKAAAALRAAGTPEVTVTAEQFRAYQNSVRDDGLPADMRARLGQLGLGRADQRRVAKIILAARPKSGPVLIAPLADASRLGAMGSLARLLRKAAVRSRRKPLVRSKGGPATVPGVRPHASQSSQRRRRGSA
jgi:hypothetical protein